MVGCRHVNEPSLIVGEDKENEEQPKRDRRHDEQGRGITRLT